MVFFSAEPIKVFQGHHESVLGSLFRFRRIIQNRKRQPEGSVGVRLHQLRGSLLIACPYSLDRL
jgi:hypothetical protein